MKAIERAAISRILIDLIKADKVIDSREIELYRELKTRFSITRKDEIEAYSLTLGNAVTILKAMDSETIPEVLASFENMTISDYACPREEALLMFMLHCCFKSPHLDCDVISIIIEESWIDERQVLYVESYHQQDINFDITTNHRSISRELKLCGWDFVYLPQVAHHYISLRPGNY